MNLSFHLEKKLSACEANCFMHAPINQLRVYFNL